MVGAIELKRPTQDRVEGLAEGGELDRAADVHPDKPRP
jgi:hypothetical protein